MLLVSELVKSVFLVVDYEIVTHVQVNLCQKLLIFASTNPQYDDRLLIGLQVQYMKIESLD